MKKRVTIKDVAKKVGVTPTTVSLVIHNDRSIPQATKEKIFKAIKELNYYPNSAARSLVRGKTDTIALLSAFFYPPFYQQILAGIENSVVGKSMMINQYSTKGLKQNEETLFKHILYGRLADALITFNESPGAEMAKEYKEHNLPLIVLEKDVRDAHTIITDNPNGGWAATEYLVAKGRKRIALVLGDEKGARAIQGKRLDGYRKALASHDIPFDETLCFRIPHLTAESAREGFRAFMESSGRKADGLFCAAGDIAAIGIMHEAKRLGIGIPSDMAVVGYDNLDIAGYVTPSLTTISQPAYKMGECAVLTAIEAIGRGAHYPFLRTVFPPELIIRESA